MSFVDEVNKEQERNRPVRTAVKANAGAIQAARAAGKPLNAIYRALKRQGQSVGKGYSSFRNAVRYLDKHGWPERDAEHPPSSTASPPPAAATAVKPVADAARDRFADNRFESDF